MFISLDNGVRINLAHVSKVTFNEGTKTYKFLDTNQKDLGTMIANDKNATDFNEVKKSLDTFGRK